MPGGFVCSGSLKGRSPSDEIRDAVPAGAAPEALQARSSAPSTRSTRPAGIELDSLSSLGPTFVLKADVHPAEERPPIVAEMWLYPDGSRILELSTKCLPNEAFQVAAEARAYLEVHGRRPERGPADEDASRRSTSSGPSCARRRRTGPRTAGSAAGTKAATTPRRRTTTGATTRRTTTRKATTTKR